MDYVRSGAVIVDSWVRRIYYEMWPFQVVVYTGSCDLLVPSLTYTTDDDNKMARVREEENDYVQHL